MPHQAHAMGIGKVGLPGLALKRKFRFTFEATGFFGTVPRHYVKTAARPQLDVEEVQVDFLNATTWFPGKARWQQITISYNDVADIEMAPLYNWLVQVYDFQKIFQQPQSEKAGWTGTGLLKMYDGCGDVIESWGLYSMWPTSINFGDLDYSSSEIANIDVTFRYSEVQYIGNCGPTPVGVCAGCF